MKNCIEPKLFVGPMSVNVVDACIEFSNQSGIPLGLIPSRRQIDSATGYVGNWITSSFASYVRSRSNLIVLQRDHGGPLQGDEKDFGIRSLFNDSDHFDLLHIDPFKRHRDVWSAASYTAYIMESLKESPCRFEIGTEEAIFRMPVEQARLFFELVRDRVSDGLSRVEYLVVQFGTKIEGTKNTGQFDRNRAAEMTALCSEFGKKSKEHNGDYLTVNGVLDRRKLGLDALNIAPEMGGIESESILDAIGNREDLINRFFRCCLATNRWQKWFPNNFDPNEDRIGVIRACGHYCFSSPEFLQISSEIDYIGAIDVAKRRMKDRIQELIV